MYKPIRIASGANGRRTRTRPPLPTSFLKLSNDGSSNPWKQALRQKKGSKFDDTFVPWGDSSSSTALDALLSEVEKNPPVGTPANRKHSHDQAISPRPSRRRAGIPIALLSPIRRDRSNTMNTVSSVSPVTPKSRIVRSESPKSPVLHIRLPSSHSSATSPSLGVSEGAERKRAVKAAKVKERNLAVLIEDPKAKDLGTVMDSLFGVGKEQSKALRCGYAGVGIASSKKGWKATDDYQSL